MHLGPCSVLKISQYLSLRNDKPLLLVCDTTVLVKQHECIRQLTTTLEKGLPYKGAREHHIVDIDDRILSEAIVQELERVVPVPSKRKPKKKSG